MYAQAIIQSVNASILFLLLNPTKKGLLYKTASLIAIVAVFGLPYYEENILWSFQNQFYWMQFFGILSFYLYTKRDTKLKFIAIAFVNFCTLFTVASGILSILVSISITFFFIFIKKKHSIHWKILFGFQFFLLFLGKLLWVSVSEHGMLKARDLSDLINAYLQILNWPNGPKKVGTTRKLFATRWAKVRCQNLAIGMAKPPAYCTSLVGPPSTTATAH
jgi:hypothetical protein